jgi:class 3 adenylate cyclase
MAGTRKLAAILVADIVGYSRLAGADEDRTLSRLRGLRGDLIDPAIDAHHGRIVKRTGDGSLIEFRSVVDAVRCAIEVQNDLIERNAGLPPERRIEFRVGIHVGDVVEENDGDLMGDGVNIAARLKGIANLGAVYLSENAYRQVKLRPWRRPARGPNYRMRVSLCRTSRRPQSCSSRIWAAAQSGTISPTELSRRSSRGCLASNRCSSSLSIPRSFTRAGQLT